ncbi:hypothetical protein N0V88_007280 [Collariella sp. IMI 366227]|nr:hypothetical protein N0V88_007280 [Collariella sp. IMI 366227]
MENRPKIDQAAPEKPKAQAGDGNTENAEALEFWYYCDCCGRKVPRHEDRHSCQDCNDFDYCPKCVSDAPLIHPGHAWIIIPAPEPLSEQNKDADAAPEAKMEEPTDEPRCPSCAPVTRILPLLKFVLDSPEKHNRMCIKWPLRLSRTIEATQLQREHNKERMELVEHCMGTLTRVKSDRFDFDVFPISSRKGANLWDFDKLTFTLGESNLKIRTREELREARVFHSAGVITAERYVFAATGKGVESEGDRLPAIAGIAREVARLTGMEYLAGLWKENMLQDLMWVARTQEWWRRPEYAENFPPAPTWSWASVQAPILCDAITEDATPLARVLNCSVESVKGKSTFDLVAGGTVEIRGPFSELDKTDVVTLLKRQDMAPAPPMSNDVQEWYKQMLEDMSTRPQGGEKGEVTEAALPERVFGLLMFERDWTKNRWDVERPKEMETCYFGLLLSKVGGGRFERIGCFYEDTSEFLDQTMQPWEQREVVIV